MAVCYCGQYARFQSFFLISLFHLTYEIQNIQKLLTINLPKTTINHKRKKKKFGRARRRFQNTWNWGHSFILHMKTQLVDTRNTLQFWVLKLLKVQYNIPKRKFKPMTNFSSRMAF